MSARRWLLIYFGLFAVSGASGLVYEVLWLRQLATAFGATAPATAAALAAFMGGLGIGGYAGGRLAFESANPLRLYALLELTLVAAAATVGPFLAAFDRPIAWAYRAGPAGGFVVAARAIVPVLVLFAPTAVMGATLPALARAVTRSPDRIGRSVGALYGWNTVGAALGAVAGGFVLISSLGTQGTLWLAMAANATVGALAWMASTRAGPTPAPRFAPPAEPAAAESHGSGLTLTSAAVSGLVALALEVVWTRMLVFFTGSTTYAFSAMVAVLLVGLATGSFIVARVGDRARSTSPVATVFAFVALAAWAGAAAVPSLGRALSAWAIADLTWTRTLIVIFAVASAAILLPAIGFGAALPLLVRDCVRRGQGVARAAGSVYAANLAGSFCGAYAGGFFLIPLAGIVGSLRLLCATLLGLAAILLWRPAASRRWPATIAAAACAALAIVAAVTRADRPLHRVDPDEDLVYYAEGASGTVSVVRDQIGTKTLFIDRIGVAGTDPVMQTDQKSLAHLPMLLHPEPRNVLTVGFGSGGASWSYTRYPMLDRIDCVEIAPEVVGAAPHLREANHDLFRDPRYRVILDDARSLLEHTDRQYDIIATDCTDLQYRGNASLYTLEYFNLCRRRLRPNGLTVVWMPLGGLSSDVFRLALNTFAYAFPQVTVWYLNNYPTHYLLLVGSESPQRVDWDQLVARMEIPDVRADLESIGLSDPYRLLSTFLLNDAAVRAFVGESAINSDAHPLIEFRAPRSVDRFSGAQNLEALLDLAARRHVEVPLVVRFGVREEQTVRAKLRPYTASAAWLNRGHVVYQSARRDLSGALALYRHAGAANPGDAHIPKLIDGVVQTRDRVLHAYEAAAAAQPTSTTVLHDTAVMLLDAGQPARAAAMLARLAKLEPPSVETQIVLARAQREAGDRIGARAAIGRAIELDGQRADAWFERGVLDQQDGRLDAARDAFTTALSLDPALHEARFNLGTVLAAMGRLAEARSAYEDGLAANPDAADARVNLAQILLLLGDRPRAIDELRRAAGSADPAGSAANHLLAELRHGS